MHTRPNNFVKYILKFIVNLVTWFAVAIDLLTRMFYNKRCYCIIILILKRPDIKIFINNI